jgi:hypothetical protein
MLVAIGSWLSANWKVVVVVVPLMAGGGKVTHGFIADTGNRLDAVEQQQLDAASDRQEIKCMIVNHDIGEPPLECLKDE